LERAESAVNEVADDTNLSLEDMFTCYAIVVLEMARKKGQRLHSGLLLKANAETVETVLRIVLRRCAVLDPDSVAVEILGRRLALNSAGRMNE
jgi:hypothetical protein